MKKCPKCEVGSMSGPSYHKKYKADLPVGVGTSAAFEESLSYRCTKCGYTESRPCKDVPETSAQAESKWLLEG